MHNGGDEQRVEQDLCIKEVGAGGLRSTFMYQMDPPVKAMAAKKLRVAMRVRLPSTEGHARTAPVKTPACQSQPADMTAIETAYGVDHYPRNLRQQIAS